MAGRAWATAWASRPCTRPSSEVCRARPCGTSALAATQGCTRWGASAVLSSSRGEPTRIRGSGGSGPPASRSISLRAGRGASAVPRWCSTMSSTATPQRSAAAITLPALVPTTRSTEPTGSGSRHCSAASAPAIQAAPSTPPAPSTRPVRGRRGRGAVAPPPDAIAASKVRDAPTSCQRPRPSMACGEASRPPFGPVPLGVDHGGQGLVSGMCRRPAELAAGPGRVHEHRVPRDVYPLHLHRKEGKPFHQRRGQADQRGGDRD